MPKKEEMLKKPNNNDKYDLLDDLDDKIGDVLKQKKLFFKELKKKNKELNNVSDIKLLKDERKDEIKLKN
jgi:hypothetical protein